MKHSESFLISIQNIDCGCLLEPLRRGGSNEYPQSMFFFDRNKKITVYPCKPQLYFIKVGFKRVKIIQVCFRDDKNTINWLTLISVFLCKTGQQRRIF